MTVEWQPRVEALPGATPLTFHHDQWWMDAPDLDVQALARTLLALDIRLSTITGITAAEGETDVIYHYAAPEMRLNVKVATHANTLVSVTPILQAAAWAEREIHDLYGVTFSGHPNLARLLRPPQLSDGFFRTDAQAGPGAHDAR